MNRADRYHQPGWTHDFPHRMGCRKRKARFYFRGYFYADRDHTLCPRCYNSLFQRLGRR